jgi:hypothetical protein
MSAKGTVVPDIGPDVPLDRLAFRAAPKRSSPALFGTAAHTEAYSDENNPIPLNY